MLNLELGALYIFKSIYETGSGRLVSEMYNISQPKVSRYLTQLREQYDDSLFIRKKSGFIPTERATLLYPIICRMTDLADEINALEKHSKIQSEYIIAVPPTFSVGLPEYLDHAFKAVGPDITLTIKPSRRGLCEEVIQGQVSIAMTHQDCTKMPECQANRQSLLEVKPIGSGEFVHIIARDEHPVWQTEGLLENIAQHPFIITQVPGFNDQTDPFETYCHQQSIQLNIFQKTHSLASLIQTILTSDSISFIGPKCAAEFMQNVPGITVKLMQKEQYRLLHSVMPRPKYSIIYRKDKRPMFPPLLMTALCEFITQQIAYQEID